MWLINWQKCDACEGSAYMINILLIGLIVPLNGVEERDLVVVKEFVTRQLDSGI